MLIDWWLAIDVDLKWKRLHLLEQVIVQITCSDNDGWSNLQLQRLVEWNYHSETIYVLPPF
jgi:hypothetical protein